MKNYRLLFVMMAAVMFAASCTEEDASVEDISAKKALAMSEDDWAEIDFCGPVRYHDLIGGQTILMGSVAVGNDGENLYVKYQADPGYVITETHLFVGDIDKLPTAGKNKNPKIGHFPYKSDNYEGSESVIHTIPLNKFKNECFSVVAHAVVECEDGTCEETAFGAGRKSQDLVISAKSLFKENDQFNWVYATSQGLMYADSSCVSSFEYGYIAVDLNNFSPMSADMLDANGNILGSLSVSLTDGYLTVEIAGENGYSLWKGDTHLFIGSMEELIETLNQNGCPDYRENFTYKVGLVEIAINEFDTGYSSDPLKLDSKRWAYYFNYCKSKCN
jgi:hypothetical protein